jgi:hypothetical protein
MKISHMAQGCWGGPELALAIPILRLLVIIRMFGVRINVRN